MSDETTALELIDKLSQVIGESGTVIVSEYATWYVWSALSWMAFAITCFILAIKWKPEEIEMKIVKVVCAIIAAMIFAGNLPDLFSPNGIAIHKLIHDLRG